MMSQRLINPRSPHGTAILSEHEGAHPQTISTASHAANGLSYDPRAWSRVDWAVARYKWYRACGLLDDSPHRPAEITRYHRSPDPPRAKPHLKWYPLSEPDDEVARPYQRSGPVTPSAPSRKRYDQRVENAHVRTILARYQAEKEEATKGPTSDNHFDPSKHPRDRIGRFTVKGEGVTTSVGEASPATKQNGLTQGEELAPKTVALQTSDGKPFYVSTDDKWRHKPSAGLHVPGLATEDVETFLDLVEQASALSDAMSENYCQLREVRNEVQSRGWTLWPSPDHLRSLKTKQAQYERDRAALQFKWDELEAEYHKAGFRDLQVTGFRVGTNSEYQQDWDRGKGLTNVVQAYRKSQEEDLRGGRGLEPTYDEMAIITAPADLVGAYRHGSALIRTGYHVVKQGAGYTLRKHLARQAAKMACTKSDEFVDWYWKKWRIPSDATDLRTAYMEEVERLAEYSGNLLGRGASEHEVAIAIQELRRGLGVKYKDSTPPDLREYIYKFNEFRYNDKLGPTYEYIRECKGLSDAQIIAGAAKTLGDKKKLGRDLFELFGNEIVPILKKYDMID